MTLNTLWKWALRLSALMVAAASLRFLIAPMALVMDHIVHYVATVPVATYTHLVLGPLALLLAPLQLSLRLRRTYKALHRASGYVYTLAVVLAGLGSLVMLPQFLGTAFAATGFAVLAVAWITTTLYAVTLARKGDYDRHRRFMLRSVALTYAAVSLRLIMAPLMASGWSVVETYQITAWGSWGINLLAVEIYLRRQSLRATASA